MPGRFAICLNPQCRVDVPYVAGHPPPKFCPACAAEFADDAVEPEAPAPALTAKPRLSHDGRVAPIFLDDQERW